MNLWQVIILAIIEGLTEFLPVSSTGHMIIASSLMGISHLEITKLITVNIQFGAILSILVLYWRRFVQSFDFYLKLLAAFIPTAILGLLLNDYIDRLLENVLVVGISLLIGGIILLFVDSFFERKNMSRVVTFPKAFTIGLFQCISMIPGVSRSAATIIGGMSQGLRRKDAAEFSFFLAVPTMFAATAFKLLKTYKNIHSHEISLLLVGNLVAFGIAMLAIKFFIGFLTRNGFKIFGYYRIVLGILIIVLYALGFKLEIV